MADKLVSTSYSYADFSGNLADGKSAQFTVYVSIPDGFNKDDHEYDVLVKGRKP